MSNTNENGQDQAQGAGLDDIMKLFSDYDSKSNQNSQENKKSKEDILAKFFTPRNGVENFRLLPALPNRDIIEKAFFHYVPVNKATTSGKGWRKIYCSAHNSPRVPKLDGSGNVITDEQGKSVLIARRCALCERSKNILSKLDNSIKYIKKENLTDQQKVIFEKNREIFKEAAKWEAKKYYIVRGIDKGKPKDGVKFWRFKENFRNQGVYDKLIPALKLFHEEYQINPTDPQKGSDLYINVVDTKMPNGTPYKDVSSITAKKPTKLHEDEIVVRQWLSDKIIWRDVFKEASMTRVLDSDEYVDRVAMGTDPYWDDRDQDNKRYVFPDPADAELMRKANEKTESLDSDITQNYEMASDITASSVVNDSYKVNISNVTAEDAGKDIDNSVNVGSEFKEEVAIPTPQPTPQPTPSYDTSNHENPDDEYDDLPF